MRYYLSQDSTIGDQQSHVWVSKSLVCRLDDEATRFGNVPTGNMHAITTSYGGKVNYETIVFCPSKQEGWKNYERDRTASGVHYRNLHVEIGEEPSSSQLELANQLVDEYATSSGPNLDWFSGFVVQTVMHEIMHSAAFVGSQTATLSTLLPASSSSSSPPITLSLYHTLDSRCQLNTLNHCVQCRNHAISMRDEGRQQKAKTMLIVTRETEDLACYYLEDGTYKSKNNDIDPGCMASIARGSNNQYTDSAGNSVTFYGDEGAGKQIDDLIS